MDDLDRLLKSEADWISPNPTTYQLKTDPKPADGSKVLLPDTDHLWGVGGDVAWVWKSFLRGMNPILMDTYRRNVLRGPGDGVPLEEMRQAMGATRRIALELDLAAMTPRCELASSRYCLAGQGLRGMEYVIYLPEGGKVSVDLTGANKILEVVWGDPLGRTREVAGQVQAGSKCEFSAPTPGDAVLWLRPARLAASTVRPTSPLPSSE